MLPYDKKHPKTKYTQKELKITKTKRQLQNVLPNKLMRFRKFALNYNVPRNTGIYILII